MLYELSWVERSGVERPSVAWVSSAPEDVAVGGGGALDGDGVNGFLVQVMNSAAAAEKRAVEADEQC